MFHRADECLRCHPGICAGDDGSTLWDRAEGKDLLVREARENLTDLTWSKAAGRNLRQLRGAPQAC